MVATRRLRPQCARHRPALQFAPFERRVELRLDAQEAHRPGTALEVVLGDGVVLRVSAGTDTKYVADLVTELRGRC